MPVRKKDNMKDAPAPVRDSAVVPKKEEAGKASTQNQIATDKKQAHPEKRVNALSTAGRKKQPK